MERFQLENLYKAAGLTDYRLRNAGDLLACHGIDFKAVRGYEDLTDKHKAMYENFLVKFYNGQGMDSKLDLVPISINFVEDINYGAQMPGDDYCIAVKHVIKAIDKVGNKKIIHASESEDCSNIEIISQDSQTYLRIDYSQYGRNEWMHILNDGNNWG